jgi:hypothetical protein
MVPCSQPPTAASLCCTGVCKGSRTILAWQGPAPEPAKSSDRPASTPSPTSGTTGSAFSSAYSESRGRAPTRQKKRHLASEGGG